MMFADRHNKHKNPMSESMRSGNAKTARDAYAVFHHGPSNYSRIIELPDVPREGYAIGRLAFIGYLPIKSSKKHHELYEHKSGDTGYSRDNNPDHWPLIVADKDGHMFIARDKSKYYINERGIVG